MGFNVCLTLTLICKRLREHIDAGVLLSDAVNFLVEKYELVRTDRNDCSVMEMSSFITSIDILRARKASCLMKRSSHKTVTRVTAGHHQEL
ncbi:toxin [Obesumbacterium proteus]|nr:toxin [Obesumbacterium proteus]